MDLNLYKKSLGFSNMKEGFENEAEMQVNDSFNHSPSFKKVIVNNIEIDSIVNQGLKDNEMKILLRPKNYLNKGEYVTFDGDTYIVRTFKNNPIYPKGTLKLCNNVVKWRNEDGSIFEYRCVVEGETYEQEKKVRLVRNITSSESEVVITVQYNEYTKKIKPQQRFVFGEHSYEVSSIDTISNVYNEVGFMTLTLKYVNKLDSDDFENQIADQSGQSGWGEW